MIINTKDPTLFYIGSSVNLGRRLQEYWDIVKGVRTPKTNFEIKLSESETSDWTVLIMAYVPPYLVLVEEQLAICTFFPTLNVNYNVLFNYWLPNFDLNAAIALAIEYRDLFEKNSVNYLRFSRLILCFTNAMNAKLEAENTVMTGDHIGTPVFVYDWVTGLIVSLFSSMNMATKTMKVSPDTISGSIRDQVVYITQSGQKVVFSLVALTSEEVKEHIISTDTTQTEVIVTLTDEKGVIVRQFDSLREFSDYYGIPLRTFRRMLSGGLSEYDGLTLTLTRKSRRIAVYCYDPNTQLQVSHFPSMAAAFKTVSIRYKTFQDIVKNNGIYNGLIYSYSSTYPL
jgi:hypothetical protein